MRIKSKSIITVPYFFANRLCAEISFKPGRGGKVGTTERFCHTARFGKDTSSEVYVDICRRLVLRILDSSYNVPISLGRARRTGRHSSFVLVCCWP
jgi:hypothetical protein